MDTSKRLQTKHEGLYAEEVFHLPYRLLFSNGLYRLPNPGVTFPRILMDRFLSYRDLDFLCERETSKRAPLMPGCTPYLVEDSWWTICLLFGFGQGFPPLPLWLLFQINLIFLILNYLHCFVPVCTVPFIASQPILLNIAFLSYHTVHALSVLIISQILYPIYSKCFSGYMGFWHSYSWNWRLIKFLLMNFIMIYIRHDVWGIISRMNNPSSLQSVD